MLKIEEKAINVIMAAPRNAMTKELLWGLTDREVLRVVPLDLLMMSMAAISKLSEKQNTMLQGLVGEVSRVADLDEAWLVPRYRRWSNNCHFLRAWHLQRQVYLDRAWYGPDSGGPKDFDIYAMEVGKARREPTETLRRRMAHWGYTLPGLPLEFCCRLRSLPG